MVEELKTFIAVVDNKSFTKAANSINISQPGVSLHIANLEKYFGTKLIERSNKQRTILITSTGKILYKRAKQILSLLNETKEELNNYTYSPSGTLKLGSSMTIGEFILPKILGDFIKEYPNVKIEVTIENTKHIYDKFKNYDIDVALIEGNVPLENYMLKNFYKDTMVVVSHSSFKYDKNIELNKFLSNQTWIHREEGSGTGENLNTFLNIENIYPKNIIILGSNYAIKQAVKNNLGITFISSLVVKDDVKNKDLKIIPTKTEYHRYFSYLCHKNNLSKVAELFIQKLNDL
ncbi:DNA-binding transcriptional LysR family regulator [Clostridium acetobutylicum]|uniref:Transcriptional regulators, LysR family n=1 Tax=Clostridium acetobutylicum (strain ATCC 824 / DSM 792 / JCM 1419 / IAM 19013 / LMG 5710 / NBRC 13948 / NRRL B-527 / VKM B-1787 / 2291 / W) TaxID=272562 RepID=Q97MU8_CLOAB|nr:MULTISPECIES: LysR substrate-binding domain-containing protein [Clostridium]AAK78078.1 Transcriptional regulators, LysR family [Clostridium acetobutylicum ATCC 824]ADZ19137.1 Transcriptional regulator, LysR family [Clostridium acetobutylicum EA 2018]AEI34171.1 LysR family transcriptional regulator [Clostridium acetobutylicum DSM 1731]AWV81859.1 LysR family transcriptional regulator [Clostridium acetobutylicum]MBC2395407.1 LysR family transcriptional regulator [Clostridium acetobutylicum]